MKPRTWTPAANARFTTAWEANTPVSTLEQQFGVSDSALLAQARRLGLSHRPWAPVVSAEDFAKACMAAGGYRNFTRADQDLLGPLPASAPIPLPIVSRRASC